MQLLLARRVNGHKLPDCVTFVAATNRRTDRAGVTGILEPVKSRFAAIVELEAIIDDWSGWAIDSGIPVTLIAFLRYRPDLLSKFEASADLVNSPVPRTWARVAQLEQLNLPRDIEAAAFAGAVGVAAATEYLAFRKLAGSLVTIDQILTDPVNSPIPTKVDELYAVTTGLAARANEQNFAHVGKYIARLTKDRGEFAVLAFRDAIRHTPKLAYTQTFNNLNAGPLGQLISGGNR